VRVAGFLLAVYAAETTVAGLKLAVLSLSSTIRISLAAMISQVR
jgi:hypothetical protein